MSFHISYKHKTVSYFLPWIQWIHTYAFISGVSLGYLFIIIFDILLLFVFFDHKKLITISNRPNSFLFLILIYMLGALPISFITSESVMIVSILNRFLKLLCVVLLVLLTNNSYIDYDSYCESLKWLTYIACFAVFIQFLSSKLTGGFVYFKVPFLHYTNESTEARLSGIVNSTRYGSIFTEPAYFAFLAFQFLIIQLFDERCELKFKNVVSALAISACIVISCSSTGIVVLMLVWGVFLLSWIRERRFTISHFVSFFALFILLIICSIIILRNEQLSFSLHRLTAGYERSKVVWKRLYAGFDKFLQLDVIQKIFGLGIGNIPSEFMNSVIYLLITTGCAGVLLFCIWLLKCFISTNICGKVATVVFAMLSAIDMVFFTPTLFAYAFIINKNLNYPKREINNVQQVNLACPKNI